MDKEEIEVERIKFDEENHKYTLIKANGEEKELISVTTLLAKHGLSPNYSGVSDEVLNAKAKRGSVVHKELEEYIMNNQIGFTGELEQFIATCEEKDIVPKGSELKVWNDEVAGTVDVVGTINHWETFIGDFKTTATLHKEAVAWQLSLYAYIMGKEFDKMLCIHFPDEHTCNVVEIKPIETEEIEKLLECERNGEIYKPKTLELDTTSCVKILTIQHELQHIDDQKKELEMAEAELKNMLIEKMEETGVKSIDNEYFKITYIAPSSRETIDSAKLKREMPEIAEQFKKTSEVKASVRITLKEV